MLSTTSKPRQQDRGGVEGYRVLLPTGLMLLATLYDFLIGSDLFSIAYLSKDGKYHHSAENIEHSNNSQDLLLKKEEEIGCSN